MPKFTFDCECGTRFTRTLKQGVHPFYECPKCAGEAPRLWDGQGFSHSFARGEGSPGNTGVGRYDNPSADEVVGFSADQRWGEINEREKVKKQVREMGGTRALMRRNGKEKGQDFIEYTAGNENLIEARKVLVKAAEEKGWGTPQKKEAAPR